MKRNIHLALLLLLSLAANLESLAETFNKPFAVGQDIYNLNITMDSFIIKPQNTNTEFQIDISYLPESQSFKNLPVIYVTDGQWRRMDHKYVHYLTYKKIIPPVIVSAIGYPEKYNADRVRMADLMGRPEDFFKAIKEEVIPLVEERFSTDSKQRFLFGASAGGYFTAYTFLKNAFEADHTFKGYIGASPYLPSGSKVIEMAKKLVAKKRELNASLYLAYGAEESVTYYHTPNNELYKTLENKNLKNFFFNHYVYPESDHFDTTRLTLIDGLRLFLGEQQFKGVGAIDLNYRSQQYDFKATTQYYDWKTNLFAANSYATDPGYSLTADTGSFKVAADFTLYNSLCFETASVFFEDLVDRELEFNIYLPQDLAELNYDLQFVIYSTKKNSLEWITDYSHSFKLNQSGWNVFKYKWRGNVKQGNADCIRGFGVLINRTKSAPAWKGDLYFDEIKW